MASRSVIDRISRFFKAVYLKLFRINDSPQKIAMGFGIGVFLGVLPFTGPIAALAMAFLLRVNRASALLGSILTNTWMSIPVFFFSARIGAFITGVKYQDLHSGWTLLVNGFRWEKLLDVGVYKVLLPILAGYAAVSLTIGIISYLLVFIVVKYAKHDRFHPSHR